MRASKTFACRNVSRRAWRSFFFWAAASSDQQAALLDLIAFQRNRSPELDPGIDFFILVRRMTADGFYTSPIGMRDVYLGNSPSAEFVVPKAAVDFVLDRSPFK